MTVNIGMSVQLDQDASGEVLGGIDRDCAIAVIGPEGTLFTIDEHGGVSGDPEAVERAAIAVGDLRARGLLALARLAMRVSRPN